MTVAILQILMFFCFPLIPPASGQRLNFIIKFCSVLFCYLPYHFFAISAASVVLTCDLIPSNHKKASCFIDWIIINARGSCHKV